MADNKQPLSPQGYNLGGEPYNTNPFWGDDDSLPGAYPPGGARGQVLGKLSSADQDVGWINQTGGGGGVGGYYYPNISTDYDLSFVASQSDMPAPPAAVNIKGPQGVAGPPGPAGKDGRDGLQGEPGPQGPAGPRGLMGEVGPAGPEGPRGATGATGATGPAGPEGPRGLTGERGPAGPAGERGPTGDRGPEGPVGPAGPAGQDGQDAELPAGSIGQLLMHNGSSWVAESAGDALAAGGRNSDLPVYAGGGINWRRPIEALNLQTGTDGQLVGIVGGVLAPVDAPSGGGAEVVTETFDIHIPLTNLNGESWEATVTPTDGVYNIPSYGYRMSAEDLAKVTDIAHRLISGDCFFSIPLKSGGMTSFSGILLAGSTLACRFGMAQSLNLGGLKSAFAMCNIGFNLITENIFLGNIIYSPGRTANWAITGAPGKLEIRGVAFKRDRLSYNAED